MAEADGTTAKTPWQSLNGGAHRFWVDRDVLWWQLVGEVDAPDLIKLMELSDGCTEQFGYCLLIIDCKHGASVTPSARRAVAERNRDRPTPRNITVLYGLSALSRGLIALTMRAITLLSAVRPIIRVCATEAEALAVMARERATAQPDYQPPR